MKEEEFGEIIIGFNELLGVLRDIKWTTTKLLTKAEEIEEVLRLIKFKM